MVGSGQRPRAYRQMLVKWPNSSWDVQPRTTAMRVLEVLLHHRGRCGRMSSAQIYYCAHDHYSEMRQEMPEELLFRGTRTI